MRVLAAMLAAVVGVGLPACGGDGSDEETLDALVRFARNPTEETWSRVPFAPEVRLGLADDLVVRRDARTLLQREAWELDVPLFRGYTGPFTALETLANPRRALRYVEGSYQRCASAPAPAPAELASLRRVSIQPRGWESCLQWFAVDVFLTAEDEIAAVTFDLWEP
jgi:hypothetical protein